MDNTIIIAALTLGFTTGFHCLGMCGPIALSLGITKKKQVNFLLQNLIYQLGRISTYTLLGLILGLVGKSFEMAGFQSYLSIFAGIVIIFMAVSSFGGSDYASNIPFLNKYLLKVKMNLGQLLAKTNYSSRYLTGILNGLLPCGMVYMALTSSLAAGGLWQSATFMALFGLGTFPFMFLVVLFGNMISVATRNAFLKFMPIVMIILGTLFILRGLDLKIPYISPPKKALQLKTDSCCEPSSHGHDHGGHHHGGDMEEEGACCH